MNIIILTCIRTRLAINANDIFTYILLIDDFVLVSVESMSITLANVLLYIRISMDVIYLKN